MFFSIRQKNIHTVNAFRLINSLFDATLRNIRRFALNSFKYFIHGKLTIQEEEAMLYIWELGSCFVKDIVAKYPKPAPPYTTVASIVKNLERKQYIRAARVGNTYQYTPLIRESEYKRTFMSGFVRNYFENSYKEMVSFFAKDQKISANDLKDIIDMIEKGKE